MINERRGRSLLALPRNAKLTLLLQPLWAIPFFLYNNYASLYMIRLGITPTEIGMIRSTESILKSFLAFFAGNIINRLGRKLSNILFDALSWLIPLLLWAFGNDFWHFFLAGVINSTVVINGIATHLYIVEDLDSEQRFFCFNFMEIILVMSGFLVPLTGYLISKYALIPTMRGIYLFGFVCMCVMIGTKSLFITDTAVGEELKRKSDMKNAFKGIFKDFRYLFGKPRLVILMAVNILNGFGGTITSLYLVPYLTEYIGFNEAEVSVFPFITSAVVLGALLLVVPRIINKERFMKFGITMYIIGALLLVISPKHNSRTTVILSFSILIVNTICWAFGRAFLRTIVQTVIADEVDNNLQANVAGLSNLLHTLSVFPAGLIGGALYQHMPVYAFLLVLLSYIISFFLYQYKNIMPRNKNILKGVEKCV